MEYNVAKTSIEKEFGNFLSEKFNLNKDGMQKHSGENPTHLRIRDKSGIIDSQDFAKKLESLGIPYKKTQGKIYSRSPDYIDNGFIVEWKEKIGVLLAIQKPGKVRRKEFTPGELKLKTDYKDPNEFYNNVSTGLDGHPLKECLMSMLDNLKHNKPIKDLDKVEKEDVSRITSDFGEILVAYKSLLAGNVWNFPKNKNEKVIDGYENNVPVSVKNEKGGGKVNLSEYKNLIDQSTMAGKFLFALASHQKEEAIKTGVQLDIELQKLIPDPSNEGLKKLMNKVSYDDFYAKVSANEYFKGLGIPAPNHNQRAKELWNQQDLNPIHFTILTLISRIWGESDKGSRQISSVVKQFLNKPKFVKVEIQGLNISITEQNFDTVEDWKTIYWSRATAAWHNYPGVEPLKGIQAND